MAIISNIGIKLTADGGLQVQRELQMVDKSADAAGKTSAALSSAFSKLKTVFAGFSVGYLANEFVLTADAMKSVNSRLKLATTSTADYAQAQRAVVRISQSQGVALKDTADLYAKLSDPVRKLGGDAKDVDSITRALTSSLRISGTTGAAAAGAITQFSQAMASGRLSGDEFNSVNEAAPRIMQTLETALGKTRGELRLMAEQGQLTADVVGNALIAELGNLETEASSMPMTVGMAFQQVKNELSLFVMEADDATGATGVLAEGLSTLATIIGELSLAMRNSAVGDGTAAGDFDAMGLAVEGIGIVLETLVVTGANVAYTFKAIGLEIGGLAAQAVALVQGDFGRVSEIHRQMKTDADANRTAVENFSTAVLGSTERAVAQRRALRGSTISASENAAEMKKLARQAGLTETKLQGHATATTATATAARKAAAAAAKHAEEQRKLSVIISDFGTDESVAETNRLRRANERAADSLRNQVAPALDETTAETARLTRQNQSLVEATEDATAAQTAAAEELARTNDMIGQSLTDALFRAFESGKGFAQSFRDTLVNAFKTMVLQPTIKALIAPVTAGMAGLLPSGASAAGGFDMSTGAGLLGSLGGTLGNLGSIFNAGMNTSLLGGLGSAGAMFGAGMPLSGAAMGLGTVAPYLAVAAGLYSMFKHTPTHHTGSVVGVDAAGMASTLWGSGSDILNNFNPKTDEALRTLSGYSTNSLNALDKLFGGAGGFTSYANFAADNNDASIGQFFLSRDGVRVGEGVQSRGGNYQLYSSNGEEAFKAYAGDVARATLEALDTVALPQWAKDTFNSLSSDAGMEEFDAVVRAVADMQTALEGVRLSVQPLGGVFFDVARLSGDALKQLADFAGGIDAFGQKVGSYVSAYYSADEQAALQAKSIMGQLRSVGINTGNLNTKEEFRALVDSRDVSTERGREQLATLLNVAEQFAGLSEYLTENNKTIFAVAQMAPKEDVLSGIAAQQDTATATVDGFVSLQGAVTTSGAGIVSAVETLQASIEAGLAAVADATQKSVRVLESWSDGDAMLTRTAEA